MDGNKRKRDNDGTVVTFYAPDRTFARVYKGQSLEETKDLVRKKLGLSEDMSIRFARLHEGKVIELDDDEDFEAFRHLARYVHSLDVSVFVGQSGPPIFTEQTSRESSTNPNISKKRNKKRQVVSLIPTSHDGGASRVPDTTSTLDSNGVPKRKRKRKNASSTVDNSAPLPPQPSSAPKSVLKGLEPSGSSEKEVSKDGQPLSRMAPPTLPPLSASHDTVSESLPPETSGQSKSSKRKRQDTPESPSALPGRNVPASASSSIPSRPSFPSSPVKKKPKKDKRTEETLIPAPEKASAVKSDKKGKRKAGEDGSHASQVAVREEATPAPDVEDAAARKAAKKAKREAKEKKRQAAEDGDGAASSKEDGKQAKKRKDKDTDGTQGVDTVPVDLSSLQTSLSEAELGPKKDKRKKRAEARSQPQAELSEVPFSVVPTDQTSTKEKKAKTKSEQLAATPVHNPDRDEPVAGPSTVVEIEVEEPLKGKKVKPRKSLSTTSSVDAERATPPPTASASTEDPAISAKQDSSESASAKKSKRDRNRLPATSSSDATSAAALSVVQAAVQAVLARASSASAGPTSASPSQPLAPLTAEPAVPGRKKKAGRSKLNQAWGPDDMVQEHGSTSISVTAPTADNVPIPTPSATIISTGAARKTKEANGKKTPRPSSAPSCLVCDKASLHPRSQCPVVEAGPVALRKRIAELKKSGKNEELVEELEVLLKEAQRRRKSAGAKRTVDASARVSVPAPDEPVETPRSSPDLPLQTLSRPTLGERSLSSPRFPAGSEISEVVVESRDEGSSSSDDEDEDEDAPASSFLPLSSSLALSDPDNLEALLYGPVKSHASILAQIPSSSSASDESDDEAEDEDVDMDEEEHNDLAFRRMSRKFARTVSSSDEDEPQPEPDQAQEQDQDLDNDDRGSDADADDVIIPPMEMDVDPNSSLDTQDARQVEADVLAQDASAVERSAEESGEDNPTTPEDDDDWEESDEEEAEDGEAKEEADAEPEAESDEVPGPARAAKSDGEPSESDADEPDESPANRGDDHRVEPVAEVDPLASQEHLEVPVGESGEREGPERDANVVEGAEQRVDGDDVANVSAVASKSVRPLLPLDEASPKEDSPVGSRGISPGIGARSSADLSGTTAQAEVEKAGATPDEDDQERGHYDQDAVQVEVIEPYTEDPNDPIESFSSDHDHEQSNAIEDDPIEDPDAIQTPPQERDHTPPPATPRTPGTIGRMKDRYGRLSQVCNREATPRLSQQLLNDLVLPQEEVTLAKPQAGGALEPSLELEIAPQVQEAEAEGEAEVEPAKTQEEAASSQTQSQPEAEGEGKTRPHRATRTTRRNASVMASSPSPAGPESIPTPTPMPTQRRRTTRLTAEEKAQREAERAQKDAEKKAERERKAAEKAAQKAVKDAEKAQKKAERERKAAEKQAEKEAKQAAKEAKQNEKAPAKRGGASGAKGRGGSARPVSTRSRRAVESVEPEEEEDVDEGDAIGKNDREIPSTANVTETPEAAKISWTTLPQQPSTQPESVGETSMIDELQSSSPELGRPRGLIRREETPPNEDTVTQEPTEHEDQENHPAVTPKSKSGRKEPLFIPSSSQHPRTPFGLPNAESTPFPNDDRQDGGGSEPEEEPDTTYKAPARRRASWVSRSMYPSLTDLASQSLFPVTQIASPALFPQTPKPELSYKLSQATYGKGDDDGDDDDDDEASDAADSSDSDSGKKKSHIPQDRLAGAGVQKKKKSGLLSAYS